MVAGEQDMPDLLVRTFDVFLKAINGGREGTGGSPDWNGNHYNFDVHLETQHFCMDCAAYCNNLQNHVCPSPAARMGHVDAGRELDLSHFSELSRSRGGMVLMYKYNKNVDSLDIEDVFTKLNKVLTNFLEQLFEIHQHSKVEIGIGIQMRKEIQDDEMNRAFKKTIIYFKSSYYELQNKYQIRDILLKSASDIVTRKNVFMENGSGWAIVNIESLEIKIGEIRLIRDVSGGGYLAMPVPNKSGFVNFRNKNDKCFLYCIAASMFADEERRKTGKPVSKKSHGIWEKYFSRLDTNGVNFPVNIQSDIPIFETNNNV
ncbi:unnamed protein product [Allacma fusca]|uniref:Uncharacterized protein n=1 Tax=Allacma fusca TaxID=39272 RepID=A0A8J2LXP7_9HEXA|nr:unnamed protein product [Allacma fusca]